MNLANELAKFYDDHVGKLIEEMANKFSTYPDEEVSGSLDHLEATVLRLRDLFIQATADYNNEVATAFRTFEFRMTVRETSARLATWFQAEIDAIENPEPHPEDPK